jgi:mannose-1-phosphate guanylyltransferase
VDKANLPKCAVLLAGGRGTRFWPRSRMRTPKQLLNIVGRQTMLRQTADRLHPLFADKNIWIVTNKEQSAAVRRELPKTPPGQVLAEPIGRNTAAAIGLAAIHLAHAHGDCLMAVLPADHHIAQPARYRRIVSAALALASAPGNMVVIGIPPAHPETGFGYIERGAAAGRVNGIETYAVKRFTEKPALPAARKYLASRRYFWNAGMFFWRVSTFLDCLSRFLPATREGLRELSAAIGTRRYESALRQIYPRLQNISVDYAVMEPATRSSTAGAPPNRVFVLPAQVGWSDIGSWAAVYELLARTPGENVSASESFTLEASGNYFWSPKKFVVAIGVRDLVMVETPDAILICPRSRAQDVSKVVKWLEEKRRRDLL